MRLVAHNGVAGRAPECLMASLLAAWTCGIDLLVVDVMITSDDHVVAATPALLARIGATPPFAALSLDELRALDPGRGFQGRFEGAAGVAHGTDSPWVRHGHQPRWPLPTVDELLALGDRIPLVLRPIADDDAGLRRLLERLGDRLARHRAPRALGLAVAPATVDLARRLCPAAAPILDAAGGLDAAVLEHAEAHRLAIVASVDALRGADLPAPEHAAPDPSTLLPGPGQILALSVPGQPTTDADRQALAASGRVWGLAPSDPIEAAPSRPPLFDDALTGPTLSREHWVASPSRRVPDTRWSCSERGFEIEITEGGSYSGAGLVLRSPIRGDFSAEVDFDVDVPVSAATLELCVVNVNPGGLARTWEDMFQEHPAFDVHGGSPYVGTERDEHDGFRAICSRGSTILTPGQQNVYNDYGRDVGDPEGVTGSLRLVRRGSAWSSWYRDAHNPGWMCCGSLVNASMNDEVWIRMAAKHWSKNGATPPACRFRFRRFSVTLR